ncbi:hypothetical protein AAF712_003192 [Marasmius tenuissimus]|uniref:Zn(2)-C6 fungal-type domain-containing protein n=1 Tax=Marasmius tenuissimus TaxID=585030 RepID=A0ABR3A981_9AGAR
MAAAQSPRSPELKSLTGVLLMKLLFPLAFSNEIHVGQHLNSPVGNPKGGALAITTVVCTNSTSTGHLQSERRANMDIIPWLDNVIGQTSQILDPDLRGAIDRYGEDSETADSAEPLSSPSITEKSTAYTSNYHGPLGLTPLPLPRPQSFELPPIHSFPTLSGSTQSLPMLQNSSLPSIHHILSHCPPAIGSYQPPTENSAVRPPEGGAMPLRVLKSQHEDQKPPRSSPAQDTEEDMGISPWLDAVIRQTSPVLNPHLRRVIDQPRENSYNAPYLLSVTANPIEVPESPPPTHLRNAVTIPKLQFLQDPHEPPAGFELGRGPSPLRGVLQIREFEDPSTLEGSQTEYRNEKRVRKREALRAVVQKQAATIEKLTSLIVCTHCKFLKIECVFAEGGTTCDQCNSSGLVCIVEGRQSGNKSDAKIQSCSRVMDTVVEMAPSEAEEFLKRTFADDSKLQAFFEQKGVMAQHWLDQMQQV